MVAPRVGSDIFCVSGEEDNSHCLPSICLGSRRFCADGKQLRAYGVGLMHYMSQCCWALHFMLCNMRQKCHVGKAKSGEANVGHRCEHGMEVLHALKTTPPMLPCKQPLRLTQIFVRLCVLCTMHMCVLRNHKTHLHTVWEHCIVFVNICNRDLSLVFYGAFEAHLESHVLLYCVGLCVALCCAVLCCAVLCCAVLCCAVLCCAHNMCCVTYRHTSIFRIQHCKHVNIA